jgi:hypothetical protein
LRSAEALYIPHARFKRGAEAADGRKVTMMAREGTDMRRMLAPIVAVAIVLGLDVPMTVHAEIISIPPAATPDAAASPPLPTVLRGSLPSAASPAPICPPGYTLSPDFGSGCVGPSGGDYSEGSPGYDYWPDYGLGYPFGGFGFGANRGHRFGFHGSHQYHHRPGFHSAAKVNARRAGSAHMGGFGRR